MVCTFTILVLRPCRDPKEKEERRVKLGLPVLLDLPVARDHRATMALRATR